MQSNKEEINQENVVTEGLVSFFDLLAQFDYEDKTLARLSAFDIASPAPVGEAMLAADQVAKADILSVTK